MSEAYDAGWRPDVIFVGSQAICFQLPFHGSQTCRCNLLSYLSNGSARVGRFSLEDPEHSDDSLGVQLTGCRYCDLLPSSPFCSSDKESSNLLFLVQHAVVESLVLASQLDNYGVLISVSHQISRQPASLWNPGYTEQQRIASPFL